MECTVQWAGPDTMTFWTTTGSGHTLAMDGAPEAGGHNRAPRPMEMMLAGAGGCSSFDVVLILQRGRHDVTGCTVKITSERATTEPKVFTKINMHFTVTGRNIPLRVVERAVKLSYDKYCSATAMLGKTAELSWSAEVIDESTVPAE
ncbi:OsmC family protein [Orrella sp. 11846]|uniref:OsmC family protein n=1 Tax=Orrella sp. 11846 TaxID=3409913 RepID=UPI003B5B202D